MMTLKDLRNRIDDAINKFGNQECFIRDEECFGYRNLDDILIHEARFGKDGRVIIIDLPTKDLE